MKEVYLKKSEENIQAAEILFENELYNSSVNRAYYAAFQSAIYAILHFNKRLDKISHELVQSVFNRELIHRRKIINSRFKTYLLEMQSLRDQADYKATHISKKDSLKQLKKSKEFVEYIKERSENEFKTI